MKFKIDIYRRKHCRSTAVFVDGKISCLKDNHMHETDLLHLKTQAIEFNIFENLSPKSASLRSVISLIHAELIKQQIPLSYMSPENTLRGRLNRMKSKRCPVIKSYHHLGMLCF